MRSTWIDRTIGYFNPKAGAERIAYRRKMELLDGVRNYEGAATGRLSSGWFAPAGDANSLIAASGQRLRDRSRDLVRNNPLAAKIATVHANNFVGPGIVPRAKTGNTDRDREINELFDRWSKTCHPEGTMDFYGMMYQAAREVVTGGETYLRRRTRKPKDKLEVPLQIQPLDSEFCDWSKAGSNGNNPIVNGIEFDLIGRRRGYWMFSQHPYAQRTIAGFRSGSSFVPASDVAHIYEPQANQIHGVPWLAPVMQELRDLKDYELAENVRKKTEACLVGVVIPGDEADDPNVGIEETAFPGDRSGLRDANGNPFERMEPGMMAYAHGGKDIRFNTPAISAGVEAYIRTRHRSIAAGARLPYELMTGDFSQANFASGKLGLLDYQRFVAAFQWHYLIPQGCQRVWEWFVEAAKLAGLIPMELVVGVEWQPPEFETINRLDDARADLIEVRMGKRSPQEMIAKTGRDPDAVLTEIDEWNAKIDATKSNVVLDSDPRKVAINGQMQWESSGQNDNGDSNAKKA